MDDLMKQELYTPMAQTDVRSKWISWSTFLFALLQSLCTAVLAISGVRILIGVGALAAAFTPSVSIQHFHQDAIRIPMMLLALVGALANLYAFWRVRSLRGRSASQWRMQPVTPKQKRSEWLQFALGIATLILLGVEETAHVFLHRPH